MAVGIEAELKGSAAIVAVVGAVPAGVVAVGGGLDVAKAMDVFTMHGEEREGFNLWGTLQVFLVFMIFFIHRIFLVTKHLS